MEIVTLKMSDIAFAKTLTDQEEWGYSAADWRRLAAFEPRGCFIARQKGRRIGVVTTTVYGAYAFVGSLIVVADWRGVGIGYHLLRRALDYLADRGVKTVELDAVLPAAAMYRRLGFKDKYLSLRFLRPAGKALRRPPLTPLRLAAIPAFDRQRTGIDRARILRRYLRELRGSIFTAGTGRLRAYCVVRPRTGGVHMIGPLVAAEPAAADEVFDRVVRHYRDSALVMGVPAVNPTAAVLAIKHGFRYRNPSLRMYKGPRVDYESAVYGILSPEKG